MGNLSAHFDDYEFTCGCGCGKNTVSKDLIDGLEKIFDIMNARAIIITSGYRCPSHSVAVGGFYDDAHTRGLAADIIVKKQDGSYYLPEDIAEAAERAGFGGIGLMNTACHVDRRDLGGYKNNHWFGDERAGNDRIPTFQRRTVFEGGTEVVETNTAKEALPNPPLSPEFLNQSKEKHTISIIIDGKEVYSGNIE